MALPLGLAIALFVIDDAPGVLFTVFGTVGLLINADFAGSVPQRLASYLLTGAIGTIALVVGWAASLTVPSAVLVTVLVAFALAFVSLLRGSIAVGTPAVLLIFVVAVSLDGPAADIPAYVVGWWLAVVVSTTTALIILPRDQRADHRSALAAAFSAAAHVARTTWLHSAGPVDVVASVRALDSAVDRLDEQFGGQPFRTSGVTARDGVLTLLVHHINSVRLLVDDTDRLAVRHDAIPLPARDHLAAAQVEAYESLSAAMADPTLLPSARPLDDARVEMTTGMGSWVLEASRTGVSRQNIVQRIGGDHLLRMTGVIVEQMVEMARLANGGDVESLERRPPLPTRTLRGTLAAQLHPSSPWFRNSARSSLGLGLGILVVSLTGVDHGFWVLLGVISILRFDALGTRRFAFQAIVGTVIGVAVGTVIVVVLVDRPTALWVLLPLAVFLSAWSSVAISYPVGQAAFSVLILVALGIIEWPPRPEVGLVRIEDILLGAAVALVIGLLMWPNGAAGHLRAELADAIRTASAYLSAAIGALATPTPTELVALRERAIRASMRASETYDIALMQRGPAEDVRSWASTATSSYLLISAGRVIADFATKTRMAQLHPEFNTAIAGAQQASERHWNAVAAGLDGVSEPSESPAAPPTLTYPELENVRTADDAYALIVAIWVVDWVRHLDRLGSGGTSGRRERARDNRRH